LEDRVGRASSPRSIPSVESLLSHPLLAGGVDGLPRALLADAVRERLAAWRARLRSDAAAIVPDRAALAEEVRAHAQKHRPGLRRVINATGVVLHTNLGRAPLSRAAADAAREAALHYTALEFDLDKGERGSRQSHVAPLLARLTGAGAALVVNNNAAAVLLMLKAIAAGRDVIVSRGQLIEIGGSFRLPEIMAASGARLVEVGTTNRTHANDYRRAITGETGALLFVHRSNFRMSGFVAELELPELVAIGGEANVPVLADLGSGVLIDTRAHGLPQEPTMQQAVAAGVAVATASGDKLLGGPQAGIAVGDETHVRAMARDPLMRALRPDKMTLAALAATLLAYCDPARVLEEIPALRAVTESAESLRARAEDLARALAQRLGARAEVGALAEVSEVGGGALPDASLSTTVVALRVPHASASRVEEALRGGDPPVIARVSGDATLLDPRTVLPGEEEPLIEAVTAACRSLAREGG
jgi:L-seryl-tRNA(Ser) seleniumtransferase